MFKKYILNWVALIYIILDLRDLSIFIYNNIDKIMYVMYNIFYGS